MADLDGAMIGIVTLDRRDADWTVRQAAGKVELGYMFLPTAWGRGYAAEARAAALDRLAGALPGEPVVLTTQTANDRSMRLTAKLAFTEVDRFEAYGAEQWFGVWSPGPRPGCAPGPRSSPARRGRCRPGCGSRTTSCRCSVAPSSAAWLPA